MATRATTTRRGGQRSRGRGQATVTGVISARILGVFLLVTLLYVLLAGRLVYLQVVRHEHYKQKAEALRERAKTIPARRGVLLDRNATLLVKNERAADVILDPNLWYAARRGKVPSGDTPEARREGALDGLAALLPDLDVAQIALQASERLPSGRFRTVNVARKVDAKIAARVRHANLPGVGIVPATRRMALNGTLAAHVLGFTDIDGHGLDGLERVQDEMLRGEPGLLEAEFDSRQRPIPGTIERDEPPRNGRDVILTLDAGLQYDVQAALKRAYDKYHAEAASAVVLDPRTGDILALANFPTYDINGRGAAPPARRSNRAVTSPFEPGSTLKVVTVSAALEEGLLRPDSRLFCGGTLPIGRRTIHCAHNARHGNESLIDVISNSCNVASAQLALRLGRGKLWEYARRFGLGERTGCGLGGESRGLLSAPEDWSQVQLANVGFGQGVAVTPLQLAAVYAAIANDGIWMRPRIVRGTRAGDGSDVRLDAPGKGRRVVSSGVARAMRGMLQSVVDEGTGKSAQLEGYTTGGKTGTAQIAGGGGYISGKYVASFVGMAPMHDPQFVILITVTAPKGAEYGGVVAAPVFKEIAEKALLARRTPPDKPSKVEKGRTPSAGRAASGGGRAA